MPIGSSEAEGPIGPDHVIFATSLSTAPPAQARGDGSCGALPAAYIRLLSLILLSAGSNALATGGLSEPSLNLKEAPAILIRELYATVGPCLHAESSSPLSAAEERRGNDAVRNLISKEIALGAFFRPDSKHPDHMPGECWVWVTEMGHWQVQLRPVKRTQTGNSLCELWEVWFFQRGVGALPITQYHYYVGTEADGKWALRRICYRTGQMAGPPGLGADPDRFTLSSGADVHLPTERGLLSESARRDPIVYPPPFTEPLRAATDLTIESLCSCLSQSPHGIDATTSASPPTMPLRLPQPSEALKARLPSDVKVIGVYAWPSQVLEVSRGNYWVWLRQGENGWHVRLRPVLRVVHEKREYELWEVLCTLRELRGLWADEYFGHVLASVTEPSGDRRVVWRSEFQEGTPTAEDIPDVVEFNEGMVIPLSSQPANAQSP